MEISELIAGRYELVKRLGRGGMGEVWAGRDRSLRRDVALKLLAVQDAALPDLPQRFEREAVAAAQINHPNVVALYDRGIHEDMLFLVMEKVAGVTLAERLRDKGPIDPDSAMTIAEEVCAALSAAHAAGVVHYDIKPHNIMLSPTGGVKVVDFGIAGFLQATFSLARSSQLIPAGTPEYGAPEQFLSERGNVRSDLYALGAVLFAMLTGHPPLTGHNALAVVRRKLDEDAPPLTAVRPQTPAALVSLVAELLDRSPERRPASAQQVRQRLRQLRDSAGQTTRPSPMATTVPQPPRPPERTPARTDEPPESDETFTVTWTAQEPLSRYPGKIARRTRKTAVVRAGIVTAVWLLVVLAAVVLANVNSNGYRDESDTASAVIVIGLATFGLCTCLALAGVTARRAREHERRSSWALSVGPHHIRTTHGTGRRTYPWDQIQIVVVQPIQEASTDCNYIGLHIQLEHGRLPAAGEPPAGWPEPRPGRPRLGPSRMPLVREDVLPVCVLGPMTTEQRIDLAQALERHGDQRWIPSAALRP